MIDNAFLSRLRAVVVLGTFAAPPLLAQCSTTLRAGDGFAGLGNPYAIGWTTAAFDPDGAGPQPTALVLGGQFDQVGPFRTNAVAMWQPADDSWASFGFQGTNIRTIAVLAGGDLVVGGNGVHRWLGGQWQQLTNQVVTCSAAMPNGDLVVGGNFPTIGTGFIRSVARWDGASWSQLGGGVVGSAATMVCAANGDLFVAGSFTQPAGTLLRWDGTSWSAVANAPSPIGAMQALPNGDLLASTFAPAFGVHRFDGASWQLFAGGLDGAVRGLDRAANGDLVAVGDFTTIDSVAANRAARWDGTSWSPLGTGLDGRAHHVTVLPGGDVVAAGEFRSAGGESTPCVARWDGASWRPLGPWLDREVRALGVDRGGRVLAGGDFTWAGHGPARHLAQWDGSTWQAFGGGTDAPVHAIAVAADGDVYVGGEFTHAGGVAANRIARWDGVGWSPLGTGVDDTVRCALVLRNGDLVVGGHFRTAGDIQVGYVARWDGSRWSTLGGAPEFGMNWDVVALAELPNGDLVAGGGFTRAGGAFIPRIARWDGQSWSPFGAFFDPVLALAVTPSGELYAGGAFVASNQFAFLARWNGSSWQSVSPLGTGPDSVVNTLLALPNGDLVAGTEGSWNFHAPGLWRWNGSSWSTISTDRAVDALAFRPDGVLVAGGRFGDAVDGNTTVVSRFFASVATDCPAFAITETTPCVPPTGPVSLDVVQPPLIGASYRVRATGFAPNALVASCIGFTPLSIPLSIHPGGVPGCELLTSTELVTQHVPIDGVVDNRVPIAPIPALVGIRFRHQFLQATFVGSAPTAFSSSDLLRVTVGMF